MLGITPKDEKTTGESRIPRSQRAVTYGEKMMAETLGKTIRVEIYEYVSGQNILVHERKISYRRDSFTWNGGVYTVIKEKVIWKKAGLFKGLRATLMYRAHQTAPMGIERPVTEPMEPRESDLVMSAEKVAIIANKQAWKNLYPSTDTMLTMVALVSVIATIVLAGAVAYLLADPTASQGLHNAISGGPQKPATTTGTGQTTTTTNTQGTVITK